MGKVLEGVLGSWDPSLLGIICNGDKQELWFVTVGLSHPGSGKSRRDWSAGQPQTEAVCQGICQPTALVPE